MLGFRRNKQSNIDYIACLEKLETLGKLGNSK